jgi:hypothetical protein
MSHRLAPGAGTVPARIRSVDPFRRLALSSVADPGTSIYRSRDRGGPGMGQ